MQTERSDAAACPEKRESAAVVWLIAAAAAAALTAAGCLITGDGPLIFLKKLFLSEYAPGLETNAGLLTVAFFGFLTSFHCIGMCGGTVLSLSAGGAPWRQGLRFQAGRILTCTAVGAVLGAVGRFVSLNAYLKALVPLICAVVMTAMALNLLGLLRGFRMEGAAGGVSGRLRKGRGAFLLGALTGIMPCGMLQVIQLYALGTGGAFSGAVNMAVFGIASAPVLYSFSLVTGKLTAAGRRLTVKLAAVIVLMMAAKMLLKSLKLMGVAF